MLLAESAGGQDAAKLVGTLALVEMAGAALLLQMAVAVVVEGRQFESEELRVLAVFQIAQLPEFPLAALSQSECATWEILTFDVVVPKAPAAIVRNRAQRSTLE